MIKLKTINEVKQKPDGKYVECVLFADTKSEVNNSITGADVEGLEDNAIIDTGSMVITAAFDVAQLNSSHSWIWG